MEIKIIMKCPKCDSEKVFLIGFKLGIYMVFQCQNCKHSFEEDSSTTEDEKEKGKELELIA